MFNDYRNNGNNWDGKISPQNVVDFLGTIGKIGNAVIDFIEDWDFLSENNRVLSANDVLTLIRRLGRTEERYKSEIAIYNAILAVKDFVYPPKLQIQQNPWYNILFEPYYNPVLVEYNKYRNELIWHTDNIPIYVSIKYGKEGVDWILDKFGDEVKRCYYARQN